MSKKNIHIQSSKSCKTVAMVIYPDAQCLDVTGPLEVFALANQLIVEVNNTNSKGYKIELLAQASGLVNMSSGIKIQADKAYKNAGNIDTLMVCGGMGDSTLIALSDKNLINWLQKTYCKVRRLASICNGAFILAEAGLLDGRKVATHWMDAHALAEQYPDVSVDADAIFIKQDNIYTSAGIMAGIDLALALVEEDFSRAFALSIAKRLVLYSKRDGGQKQFSGYLASQFEGGEFEPVINWMHENLERNLTVNTIADFANMSPRNFARKFKAQLNVTPGKFVEAIRVELATQLLEAGDKSIPKVANISGFKTSERLRRAFLRNLKVLPSQYQRHFSER